MIFNFFSCIHKVSQVHVSNKKNPNVDQYKLNISSIYIFLEFRLSMLVYLKKNAKIIYTV